MPEIQHIHQPEDQRLNPEAIRKIIIPMASPAKVSVTQDPGGRADQHKGNQRHRMTGSR